MVGSKQLLGRARTAAAQVVPFPAAPETAPGTEPVPDATDERGLSAARWWCAALDGRELGSGDEAWEVRVAGTHVDGQDLWIQLQSADDPSQSVVLHVVRGASWHEAMSALRPPWDR